jgi:hypothetical protein
MLYCRIKNIVVDAARAVVLPAEVVITLVVGLILVIVVPSVNLFGRPDEYTYIPTTSDATEVTAETIL